MTQQDVALYYYVKMCSKKILKTISFSSHLGTLKSSLSSEKH
jgi:hypothetical protein